MPRLDNRSRRTYRVQVSSRVPDINQTFTFVENRSRQNLADLSGHSHGPAPGGYLRRCPIEDRSKFVKLPAVVAHIRDVARVVIVWGGTRDAHRSVQGYRHVACRVSGPRNGRSGDGAVTRTCSRTFKHVKLGSTGHALHVCNFASAAPKDRRSLNGSGADEIGEKHSWRGARTDTRAPGVYVQVLISNQVWLAPRYTGFVHRENDVVTATWRSRGTELPLRGEHIRRNPCPAEWGAPIP